MGDGVELPSADRETGEDHAGGDSRNEDAVRSVSGNLVKSKLLQGNTGFSGKKTITAYRKRFNGICAKK